MMIIEGVHIIRLKLCNQCKQAQFFEKKIKNRLRARETKRN